MPQPSALPGMGARPTPAGTSFRVWAPFASTVAVAGGFNGWDPGKHELAREGNGYWSVDVPGARPGHEYKYVIRNGTGTGWRVDPYAREMRNSNGNGVIVAPPSDWSADAGYRMPPWDELVIYEMHAGTFNDVPGGGPGTFDDVIRKLDYLRDDLGINAIKVLPAAEFPTGQSLGYNPAHLFAIETEYGGPAGFERFVKAAHQRGMAVILDVVYNHLGPNDMDLQVFDGWSDNTHPDGIYFYDNERRGTPWGPRPDYGRPEVRQFLRDNALFWLDEFHVDGLRFDATSYIHTIANDGRTLRDGWRLLAWVNEEVDGRFPWKITVAEDLQNNAAVTEPTDAGGASFDTQWDAGFVHPVRWALAAPDDAQRDMDAVAAAIYHRYDGNALARVIYTESHDEVLAMNGKRRLVEDIWPGNADSWAAKKRSTLGAALVMTSPGIPMIFQGQEFIEDGAFDDGVPLDWWRRVLFGGIVTLYRDLIRLRRNWFDATRGLRGQHVNVFHRNGGDKVLAMHRWHQGGPRDDVVVVLNFGNRGYDSYTLGFPRAGRWAVRFNSDWNGYDAAFGNAFSYDTDAGWAPRDGLPASGNVGLGPYSAIILSQDG